MKTRIELPASMIPEGSIVTKVTGEKNYILKRSIKIYDLPDGDERHTELKPDGVVFLCSDDGRSFNAIPASRRLMWRTTLEAIWSYLEDEQMRYEEENSQ